MNLSKFLWSSLCVALLQVPMLQAQIKPVLADNGVTNGYRTLLLASKLIETNFPGSVLALDSNPAQVLQINSLIQAGLAANPRFELIDVTDRTNITRLSTLKKVQLFLVQQGKKAESANNPGLAASNYVTLILYSHGISYGGPYIDQMLGFAMSAVGARELVTITPKLSADTVRYALHQTKWPLIHGESLDQVNKNEISFVGDTLGNIAIRMMTSSQLQAGQKNFEKRHQAAHSNLEQLQITLASRLYELDNGRSPEKLELLVPKYLSSLPKPAGSANVQGPATKP